MYAPEKSVARYVETPVGTFDVEYLRKHNLCIGCDSGPRGSSWEDVLNSNNEIVEDGKAMKYDTELPQTILDLLNCHPACHLSDDDNIREKIDIPIDTNNPLSLKDVLDGRLESCCTLGPHLDTLYKQSKMKTGISK